MQQILNDNDECGCCKPMLPHASSDKRPVADELFKHINWLIMCTDVKSGQ